MSTRSGRQDASQRTRRSSSRQRVYSSEHSKVDPAVELGRERVAALLQPLRLEKMRRREGFVDVYTLPESMVFSSQQEIHEALGGSVGTLNAEDGSYSIPTGDYAKIMPRSLASTLFCNKVFWALALLLLLLASTRLYFPEE
jgi:hypothetical protein